MIISRGRRYIFVHIPKTGGTSMALALEARAMKDDILIGDTPKARRRRKRLKGVRSAGRLWKHSRLTDICGLVAPDEIERFFVFTLVRNPLISAPSSITSTPAPRSGARPMGITCVIAPGLSDAICSSGLNICRRTWRRSSAISGFASGRSGG